jgi:hypothetical protein
VEVAPVNEGTERSTKAVSVPIDAGSPSMGVAAPIGAVSRKDRQRAGKTSLRREGTSTLVLLTALPGSVRLQRGDDGSWETLEKRPASRLGRTRIELPQAATASAQTFRVVFLPRNPNITSWVSEEIGG